MEVHEDRCHRDVGHGKRVGHEPVAVERFLEVVEAQGDHLGQRGPDQCLVRGLAEELGREHALHEQAAQHVRRQPTVDELLDPEDTRELSCVTWIQRRPGIRALQVLADHRGIRQRETAIFDGRNEPKRAQIRPAGGRRERDHGNEFVGNALLQGRDDDLAGVCRKRHAVNLQHVSLLISKECAR